MKFSPISRLGVLISRPKWSLLKSDGVKRAIDVCGAIALLVVFSPVLVLCGVALRFSGDRSVIFRQERVGQGGRPFKVLKLTTMRHDAHLAGPLVSTGGDLRATRTGRIIRAFCFNELPQLFNVLRGEMSLVGPRPEVPKFVARWAPEVKDEILSVRPGITGLATVRIWHEASLLEGKADVELAYLEEVLPKKQQLDLWYLRNRGLWLDLRIMFLTLVKALSGSRLFRSIYRARQVVSLEEKA